MSIWNKYAPGSTSRVPGMVVLFGNLKIEITNKNLVSMVWLFLSDYIYALLHLGFCDNGNMSADECIWNFAIHGALEIGATRKLLGTWCGEVLETLSQIISHKETISKSLVCQGNKVSAQSKPNTGGETPCTICMLFSFLLSRSSTRS